LARKTSATDTYGKIVWSWPPDAEVKLCSVDLQSDGGYQARHSRESTYKPSNQSRRECRLFRCTCGDLLACFLHLHARLRVRSLHRHSLCPHLDEGRDRCITRAFRAAGMHRHITSAVMPREAGASSIPEAETSMNTAASGILDRPIKSGDDTDV
jgi:hypothetical protein